MSGTRNNRPFYPLTNSSAPAFTIAVSSTASLNVLESTSGAFRLWQGPSDRAVRLTVSEPKDTYFVFGSSLIAAASSDCILHLGGTVEVYYIEPGNFSYISAICATATGLNLNVTLGYAG